MSSTTTIRKFRWQDLPRFTELFNEINGITSTEKAYDVGLMGQVLSQPACNPEENCLLVESDGSPVGFALIAPELPIGRTVASGGVTEPHRNRGIGRSLIETAVEHAAALGASVLHVQVPSDGQADRHLLESSGFRSVRTYSTMRWEGTGVPPPELPPGFGLRPFRMGRDEEALTRLQNAAFGESWGFCPNTVEEIEARINFKICEPEGVVFVTHGEGLAGYNWTFRTMEPTTSTGWIGMTGVHPDYRGYGLGRPVVLAGMEYLAAKGARTVDLEVDEQNAPAVEIYLSIGFRKVQRTLWYEKALSR